MALQEGEGGEPEAVGVPPMSPRKGLEGNRSAWGSFLLFAAVMVCVCVTCVCTCVGVRHVSVHMCAAWCLCREVFCMCTYE